VAVPAILPDGSVAPESISAIIDATPIEERAAPEADAHALTGPRRETPYPEDRGMSEPASESMSQRPAKRGPSVSEGRR
jgi:NADH-quinone oxidoreductase subunit J